MVAAVVAGGESRGIAWLAQRAVEVGGRRRFRSFTRLGRPLHPADQNPGEAVANVPCGRQSDVVEKRAKMIARCPVGMVIVVEAPGRSV